MSLPESPFIFESNRGTVGSKGEECGDAVSECVEEDGLEDRAWGAIVEGGREEVKVEGVDQEWEVKLRVHEEVVVGK